MRSKAIPRSLDGLSLLFPPLRERAWPEPAVHQARQIGAIQRSGITKPGTRAKGESLKRLIHLLRPSHEPNIDDVVAVGQSRGHYRAQ